MNNSSEDAEISVRLYVPIRNIQMNNSCNENKYKERIDDKKEC